jgi:hypothetical protein
MIYNVIVLLAITILGQTQNNAVDVSPVNYSINAVTNYTWTIFFNGTTSRTSVTLTFPPQITINNASKAYLSGTTLLTITSSTTNTLILNTNSNSILGNVIIVVTNVINPPSAISTTALSVTTNMDSSFAVRTQSTVSYAGGSSSICPWTFSLCT